MLFLLPANYVATTGWGLACVHLSALLIQVGIAWSADGEGPPKPNNADHKPEQKSNALRRVQQIPKYPKPEICNHLQDFKTSAP